MSISRRWAADPWVRGWCLGGALMLAVAAIVGLPWLLWVGWAYLGVLVTADARRTRRSDAPGRRTRPV